MKIVKYVMIALAAVAVILSFVHKLPSYGSHGITVLVTAAIPLAMGIMGTFVKPVLPRWAAIVSALAFIVMAMKTRGGELQNLMMIGALGFLVAVALAIRPDRAA
jgi:hypothetical protein